MMHKVHIYSMQETTISYDKVGGKIMPRLPQPVLASRVYSVPTSLPVLAPSISKPLAHAAAASSADSRSVKLTKEHLQVEVKIL